MDIDLPITIDLGRKSYALNLNIYRNAHYQILNKMKVTFTEQVNPILEKLPLFDSIELTYTLYPKRQCDVSNVCSIVDKFFCDALVKANKIPDDNFKYIKNIQYKFGSIDKLNPRVTVTIKGNTSED